MAYTIKFLAVIALLGSIAWAVSAPGFDSALAVVGSLSALVAAFVVEKRRKRRARQHQSVSKSSVGIQAGGNVSIGAINSDRHAK